MPTSAHSRDISRGRLLAVAHDVMLRLYFGDLIMGSRLYFLKSKNPTVQRCVRDSGLVCCYSKHGFSLSLVTRGWRGACLRDRKCHWERSAFVF
jgi:hypothetical protein